MLITYIDNFNSKIYKEYLELINTIQDFKTKILNDVKAEDKGYFYKEDKDEIHVKFKKNEIKITKPVYKNIEDELIKLKNEKKEEMFLYENLKYNIVHELNSEQDYKKYDKVVNKLLKIDKDIEDLIEYYKKVNLTTSINKAKNQDEINEINEIIVSLNKKFKNDVFKDDIEKKKSLEIYKKNLEKKRKIEKNYYNEINYIIIEKPKINYLNNEKIKKKKKEEVKEKKKSKKSKVPKGDVEQVKRYKLKEKIKEKNEKSSNIPVEEKISKLEKKIKDKFFAEFKFKNEKECSSGSHSKEYFIKKPNLLKIIKKYPEIKENLPKEYNKLSKDKICEELYKL